MSRPPKTTIALDIPAGWLVGIDLYYFTSTPTFKGIKSIPPGRTHILHWGQDETSVRNGVVFEAKEGEVLIFKWDSKKEEMLTNQTIDIAEALSIVPEQYPYMLAFDTISEEHHTAESADFATLTNHVTQSVVSSVIAPDVVVSSTTATAQEAGVLKGALQKSKEQRDKRHASPVAESDVSSSTKKDASHDIPADEMNNITPGFENLDKEPTLNFPALTPDHTWRPGSTGRERTLDSLDSSWYIENVLLKDSSSSSLLGYLQLSFLLCLVLSNYSSSITWRDYIKILCKGEELSSKNPDLYVQFFDILVHQLTVAPAEYLDGLLELSALMEPLGNLKEIIFEGQRGFNNEEDAVNPRLKRGFDKLEGELEKMGYKLQKPEED
ncbi:A1 cistron-splicing factor [Yarrowia lipolytica]|jgi:A1 cistron-splicing factor AAR2|uniref:YALI0A01782p n=2 Tax=Yarrowia lipolytica TaxID=4952 RepID=Q6CI47_YARLI|nr:YALI0A01782p [Yarrowia lipolytica CLIB122]AOW00149.1 hypothetical protein YALI1_A02131g [Yarrowia lipolytica]KAB8280936.1 A1 cistron-splicing factor [Yarrowia lipolytica]KAE8170215.1 A1 cistron-splicing factor [Yarrowia lipolytica]KAJ8051277.1 A1 cistron-splicing factor [Yarrowia lipolytica]QNP95661.1 Hypothetical protein YALI2_A00660g [Yarrowia lipolytica]|eukprot:XP_499664.1 YALI0A01782p [Yarrowia lipolytica CLIB122]